MNSNDSRPRRRPTRMADLIREEVASFILKGLKDPRVGFVTITQVKMTDDIHLARIYFSAYGTEKEKEETTLGLVESANSIRNHLAKTLRVRTVPRLEFFMDEGLEHSYRIQELLCGITNSAEHSAKQTEEIKET